MTLRNKTKNFQILDIEDRLEILLNSFPVKDDVTIYNETGLNEIKFSGNAQDPRRIIDWLPRILLLFTLLHLIPRIYWEQNVGHILKSYLSHIANLIAIIKGICN